MFLLEFCVLGIFWQNVCSWNGFQNKPHYTTLYTNMTEEQAKNLHHYKTCIILDLTFTRYMYFNSKALYNTWFIILVWVHLGRGGEGRERCRCSDCPWSWNLWHETLPKNWPEEKESGNGREEIPTKVELRLEKSSRSQEMVFSRPSIIFAWLVYCVVGGCAVVVLVCFVFFLRKIL